MRLWVLLPTGNSSLKTGPPRTTQRRIARESTVLGGGGGGGVGEVVGIEVGEGGVEAWKCDGGGKVGTALGPGAGELGVGGRGEQEVG